MKASSISPTTAPDLTSASFSGHVYPRITVKQTEFYRENGYLVVEDALSPPEIEELCRETVRICRGELGAIQGVPTDGPLSAEDSESTLKLDVQAMDAAGADLQLSDDEFIKAYLCIHNPHKISGVMRRYLAQPTMVKVLTQIIGPNVKAMQSMLFVKAAGKPGQAWHQDEYYIPTRDRSLCGGWMALDRATLENGCLWVIPGSHKHGVLWPQHWHGDRRFDCGGEAFGFYYRDEEGVPVEVNAGGIVFLTDTCFIVPCQIMRRRVSVVRWSTIT
jgi:phytanoyl-CoA hydroxylase